MTETTPKFDIEKLNLHYGAFHALKDINMQIDEHKITAFIGPSGCGKSTFLKTLNRMNDLVENVKIDGKVELDGKNIFKDMDAITLRHKVGMVFQQPNPFPKSIYDNVAYGPRIFGITKKSDLDEIVERSLKQAAILDEIGRQYMTVADAKGMSRRRAVVRHAFGNALIPIITYLGTHMAGIIGGASIVETIFAIPGIGSYAIAGVQSKDYYVVQAYVLFSGCIYVLTNILIDLIYIALDPKIRAGEAVES